MLTGAPNFRDLGGYAAGAHRKVRKGVIYRSSQLSCLTDADIDTVQALGIAVTIDLRSDRERRSYPTPGILTNPGDYLSPKSDTNFIFDRIFATSERTEDGYARAFGAFYNLMLDTYAPEFGAMFRAIASGNVPLLLHCSAGKDRTGVASALILDFLGVERDVILQDYLRSSERLADDIHFQNMLSDATLGFYSELPLACRQILLGTDPAYLQGLFATVDKNFGSTERYVTSLGLSHLHLEKIMELTIEKL